MSERPFFVGYLGLPRGLRFMTLALAVSLLIGGGLLATVIARAKDDPGPGTFRFDYGRQTVTGIVALTPTPILHVTKGSEHIEAGRTLMLSGQGKNGALLRARALEGRLANASGILLTRGDLDMMQLVCGEAGLGPADGDAPMAPEPEDLGRWELAGEICDGKCAAGAMRPGTGIAHKACASLCILNGLPPVFISTRPIEGETFLLIAGTPEDPMPPELYDWVAEYVALKGQIVRHGDLLVLDIDTATLERTP
ncbi:hypothetical protein ROJ8625_00207 [Roseivivax jejudonensis]|uniref:Uncharacterized protein n=1 Tax=Roseivivax jejudonensis TaxID=1529041 RepID=A0A1X6Y5C0_9RHOB|nr:hypothetical protein [Roseivivax jejudonensis]SLN10383.1 hypothetical protein ROJ8625_00207 [Roseivivax jejudonensis]